MVAVASGENILFGFLLIFFFSAFLDFLQSARTETCERRRLLLRRRRRPSRSPPSVVVRSGAVASPRGESVMLAKTLRH